MVDQLILNQNKNKNQLTFQKVWISAINFSIPVIIPECQIQKPLKTITYS